MNTTQGNNAPTPETDACQCTDGSIPECDELAETSRRLECERDKLREALATAGEVYKLDTQCLRAERDEARAALRRCQNEYIECCHDMAYRHDTEMEAIKTRLQTVRDEAFGAAPVSTADENITAIESGITAMRMENHALREAIVERRVHNAPRDLCGDSRITVHADVGMPGDPTSDVDPSVTPEQLRDALLTHCRTSRDQLREIEQANSLLDRNDPSNISQD
jgi:hypothetical protein